MSDRFQTIILIGRPAAGKSEVIDFLRKTPEAERAKRFHIGAFVEIDDFPFVWESFEVDDLLEQMGEDRIFTDEEYFFKGDYVWHLFIERICLEFKKKRARDPEFTRRQTVVVEFARGGPTGFRDAFAHLSDEILVRAGIVYIDVSYEESVRKNRRRFDPAQADSILYHGLPDEKMEFYYKTNDWHELTGGRSTGTIRIRNHDVPFSVFHNEPEQTDEPGKLGRALEHTFGELWKLMTPAEARRP